VTRLQSQPETPGVASVVIVNYRGADDTCAALAALHELRWPRERLEVIVVDNASGDGSVERIAKEHPQVEVLALDQNRGFAAGCNAGAEVATGQYLAFLNNDARPDPEWIAAAKRLELRCHIGRVGTFRRVRWAMRLGADSLDSCLPLYSVKDTARRSNFTRFLDALEPEAQLPLLAAS